MNRLSSSLVDYFKERSLGALFFTSFAAILGLASTGAVMFKFAAGEGWLDYWPEILPSVTLLLLFLGWRSIRAHRQWRRGNRYQSTPLAQDEWIKARRKLAAKSLVNSR